MGRNARAMWMAVGDTLLLDVLVVSEFGGYQACSYRCSPTFLQVPTMEIGTQDVAERITAFVLFSYGRKIQRLAGIVAIAPIKDFTLVEDDWLLLCLGSDVLLEGLEFLIGHQRKDVSDGVEFVFSLGGGCGGSAHRVLPSTIACKASSHSERSQRLELGPTFTGLG